MTGIAVMKRTFVPIGLFILFGCSVIQLSLGSGFSQNISSYGTVNYPATVLLHIGMETGDLSEWDSVQEHPDYGSHVIVQKDIVRSGKYAIKFVHEDPSTDLGRRADVFKRGKTKAYYAGWFYFPKDFKVLEWHALFGLGYNHPEHWERYRICVDSSMRLHFINNGDTHPDIFEYSDITLPLGRWFQVQIYFKTHSTEGRIKAWVDGKLFVDWVNYNTHPDWAPELPTLRVNHYCSTEDPPSVAYFDDAVIDDEFISKDWTPAMAS